MKLFKTHRFWLLLIFLGALAIRLFFAFQSPHFSDGEAYFTLRQVESIKHTGLPLINDDLSFSGRTHIFAPLYYYLLALFSLVLSPTFVLKVIPNILASLFVIVAFAIAYEISKNRTVSLYSALAAAFIPVFFSVSVNTASIHSLLVPLMFYMFYCFMRINQKKYLHHFIFLSFILPLTSALAFLFVLSLLIYLLLVKMEFKKQNRLELEIILFFTFLVIWIEFLLFKKAFLFHSYEVIWSNIPGALLAGYFQETTIGAAIAAVGLIPLILGIFTVYKFTLKERNRQIYLLVAIAMSVTVLLWARLITINVGLLYLGATLVLLMAPSIKVASVYIEKTNFAKLKRLIFALAIILLILTSFLPSTAKSAESLIKSISDEKVEALEWLKENSAEGSVVLATPQEGHAINSVANRKNVADTNFLLVKDSDLILEEMESAYNVLFKTKALELLGKHHVNYIMMTEDVREDFSVEEIKYIEDDCFEKSYDENDIKIYKVKCKLRVKDD